MYREWVAVSVVAAALQRKCYLRWGELTFYPNMYVVLVGPSGKCRKGTAMSVGAKFLRSIGINMAAEAITREALIRELNGTTQMFTEPDGTLVTHASLTIYSQELTVFLGYDNKQLISDITDWYDCRDRWTYRTKNMGTDKIIGVWVNLIGATTPDLIRTALPQDAIGGGLASRMIFVYEENKGKTVAAPFLTPADMQLQKDLTVDLEDIYATSGMMLVTDEFIDEWVKWYTAQDANPPFTHANFSGYVARRPNHVLKLCMVLAASENSRSIDGSSILITERILERAVDLLERTEMKMPRTFMGYGRADDAEVLSRMMDVIAKAKKVTRARMMQIFYADLGSVTKLDAMIEAMVSMQFISTVVKGSQTWLEYNPNNPYNKIYNG